MTARLAAVLALALAAASCGGDGVIVDAGGPPVVEAPTLTALQASIFTPKCALPACHAAPSPQQGMELSPGHTYPLTVDVDSTEVPAFKRIAPGNAADSYLYMKLAGDPRIVADRMPLDGFVTPAEIDAVRAWIDAGAMDN